MSWLRSRLFITTIVLLSLLLVLFAADALCYSIALPVEIDVQDGKGTLHVGSQVVSLGTVNHPTTLAFATHDPVVHEYQIDDSDSTNNFSLDPTYLNSIASSPYYRFQSWMRDLDGTSRWRNLQVWADGHALGGIPWPQNGSSVSLPPSTSLRLSIQLQRPETPMMLTLTATDGSSWQITLDRNDRAIDVTRYVPATNTTVPVTHTFFPIDIAPFIAMVIDFLIRTMIWAVLVLLAVITAETLITLARLAWLRSKIRRGRGGAALGRGPLWSSSHTHASHSRDAIDRVRKGEGEAARNVGTGSGWAEWRGPWACPVLWSPSSFASRIHIPTYILNPWKRLTNSLHPVALLALIGSLIFVAWIARVQYNAEPHIYDASAYLFAAKMYAIGQLSVPAPAAIDRFPGPFMVVFNGRWFAQYDPGTSLTLVPGIWLGVPWLVEPILGTFALLGIGLIAARLYNRRVATLAVLLGVLSPFYSYLAASYLSHTVALFYLVWGLWAFLRFAQGEANWNLPLSAVLFGMAFLTRDLVALLFIAIVVPGVLLLSWKRLHWNWSRGLLAGVTFTATLLTFFCISLDFNALLTGNLWLPPRALFFAGDHWGFGQGVGFYGQHTLAAGFVNLNELLTSLAIDLYGWPFYLTLVFLAIPFLTKRAVGADWLMLVGTVIMTGAFVGYFYHGIYLGPRYLYETLPFLLILTARGIVTLAATALEVRHTIAKWLSRRRSINVAALQAKISAATVVLVVLLVACNLLYFIPRQITLHTDYSGLPSGYHIDLPAVYHPPVHNAIIITSDYTIYQFVLFPLNDPLLHGDVLYAFANTSTDYAELRAAFPGRILYRLDILPDGSVKYVIQ